MHQDCQIYSGKCQRITVFYIYFCVGNWLRSRLWEKPVMESCFGLLVLKPFYAHMHLSALTSLKKWYMLTSFKLPLLEVLKFIFWQTTMDWTWYGAKLYVVVCGVSFQTTSCSPSSYVLEWDLFQWATE